jgi:purine-binding chemotaxis protein CheW
VERSVIEPPPELAIGIDADYLSGVAKLDGPEGSGRLLILLDVERVLADEEHDALPQGAADAVPIAV